jgi:hypothetical protein
MLHFYVDATIYIVTYVDVIKYTAADVDVTKYILLHM